MHLLVLSSIPTGLRRLSMSPDLTVPHCHFLYGKGTDFCGFFHGVQRKLVGLDDLIGLLQPEQFYEFMILSPTREMKD